ncbi:hypothetical protein [Bacillus sp. SG-1]|uniref:hypothetical protein n=1 Tax=Bacillus sp. SG-1 TaxID=161544 RepID=UPI0005C45D53|nr:hypothetical protein [Bacillus sp. SG-1]
MKVKRYSWLSYSSIGLGILLILHPLLTNVFPKYFMNLQYIGIPLTIIVSLFALQRKNEKKLLATIGLSLGIIMMLFVAVILYISLNKYSPI